MASIQFCLFILAIYSVLFVAYNGRELLANTGNPLLQSNKTIIVLGMLMAPPPRLSVASSGDATVELKRKLESLKKMVSGLQIALAAATIINVVINA